MGCVLGCAARSEPAAGAWGQSAAGRGHRQSAWLAAQGGGDHARHGDLPRRPMRGEDRRGAPGDHISRSPARSLRRAAAVHRVPRHRLAADGGDRENRSAVGRLQVRRGPGGPLDRRADVETRLAGHVQYVAVVPVRRNRQRARDAAEGEQPRADCGARHVGVAGGLSAAAHVLLGARNRDQPRLRVVSERRGGRVCVRRAAGRTRGDAAVRRQFCAVQRATRHAAAYAGVSVRQRRRRAARARSGARADPRRSLQGSTRLSGDEPSLPHGSGTAAARRRQPRRRDSRSAGAQVARHHHRQSNRFDRRGWRPRRSSRESARGDQGVRRRGAETLGRGLRRDAQPGVLRQPARRAHRPAVLAPGVLDAGPRGGPAAHRRTIRRSAACTASAARTI